MTQKQFYHSTAWRRLSRAYMLSQHYICERCGKPAEICHHRQHLNAGNVDDAGVALNPDNLEALCLACHNAEHFGSGRAIADGLAFDGSGNVVQDIERY